MSVSRKLSPVATAKEAEVANGKARIVMTPRALWLLGLNVRAWTICGCHI